MPRWESRPISWRKRWSTITKFREERGSYTIEGALTITIFTICILALSSILIILKVEGEVQDALDRTALQLSQYSYAMEKAAGSTTGTLVQNAVETKMPSELLDVWNSAGRSAAGAILAASSTKSNFNRDDIADWLTEQGVVGGMGGIDFSDSEILSDGQTIKIVAEYQLEVRTYNLFEKILTIREQAVTRALLPEECYTKGTYSGEDPSSGDGDSDGAGIWQANNFVRGQYFLKNLRAENSGQAVKTGQGIDLYDESSAHYVEGYSINVFQSSYSTCNGDAKDSASYILNSEEMEKTLAEYAAGMDKDIQDLNGSIEMEDGRTLAANTPSKKTMIVIVPEEAQESEELVSSLESAAKVVSDRYGVTIEYRYSEKAFVEESE